MENETYLIIFLILVIIGLGIIIYKKKFNEKFTLTTPPTILPTIPPTTPQTTPPTIPPTTKPTTTPTTKPITTLTTTPETLFPINYSIKFNYITKDYISVKNPVNNFNLVGKSFTIEWWQFRSDINENAMFFNNGVIGLGEIKTPNSTIKNGWLFMVNGTTTKIFDTTPLNIKAPVNCKWNHIALSVIYNSPTNSQYFICINGNAIVRVGTSINKNPTKDLIIGNDPILNGYGFQGYIAGFRVIIGNALYTTNTYTIPSKNYINNINNINTSLLLASNKNNQITDLSNNNCLINKYGNAEIRINEPIPSNNFYPLETDSSFVSCY